MKISIRKPIGYTEIGRKDQQEDAVWPPFDKVTAESRCIVLCDGVGGSAHGEIASQTASKVIGEYLTSLIKKNRIVTDADVQNAVKMAYDELEKIDTEDSVDGQPSMATTLTCVCIHDEGILAAHMGDSRIYLVRPGQGLLYQTSDHSLVNALLQAGELTLEEAKNFPRKNVITKAIQPHAQKRFNAEVHQLTDIRSGDYIFMCCDGVLEQLTNKRLVDILSMKCSDEKKLALLEAESTDRTKDNYTAYLIPIDKVDGKSTLVNSDEIATVEIEQSIKPSPIQSCNLHHKKKVDKSVLSNNIVNNIVKKIIYGIGAVALLALIFFIGKKSSDWFNKNNDEIEKTINGEDPIENGENIDISSDDEHLTDSYERDYYSEPEPVIIEDNQKDELESVTLDSDIQDKTEADECQESDLDAENRNSNTLSAIKENLKPKKKLENQNK